MLATAIRKNTNIKGISVNNVEIKLSQYADDTTLILEGSRESLLSSLAMLDDFSKVSGLRLNDKKTEALWIGASIGNMKILLSRKELVSSAAVVWVVTQRLVGEKRCVTTQITAAEETRKELKWPFDITLKKYGCQNFFSYNLNVRDTLLTITTSDAFLK